MMMIVTMMGMNVILIVMYVMMGMIIVIVNVTPFYINYENMRHKNDILRMMMMMMMVLINMMIMIIVMMMINSTM
jgi:hypothetical protein